MNAEDTRKMLEIDALINQCGGRYDEWFVGVTHDVAKRLFEEHHVVEAPGVNSYITRRASSNEAARAMAKLYLEKGCDGAVGKVSTDNDMVYAYRKKENTRP
ncbi:MAG: hypothetical protein D6E12_03390 [Desulfovibrio sp.]|nr:MAG: hypothetical protein D6E12_03390 [Desulfovibrio sp.]